MAPFAGENCSLGPAVSPAPDEACEWPDDVPAHALAISTMSAAPAQRHDRFLIMNPSSAAEAAKLSYVPASPANHTSAEYPTLSLPSVGGVDDPSDAWGPGGRPVSSESGGPVRVGIYVRVNSRPPDPVRDRLSLETQVTWCVEECERRGWSLEESFTDVGVGLDGDRPALARALEAAHDGTIDVLVTADPGRIAAGDDDLRRLASELHPVMLIAGDTVVPHS